MTRLILFWISAILLAYHYVGYPLLLFLLNVAAQIWGDIHFLIRRPRPDRRIKEPDELPTVAVIISAFNEQLVIADKLNNTRLLDYPTNKLQVFLGLDAPTDSTASVAAQNSFPALQIHEFPVRRGKLGVLRDLSQRTSAQILIFTDANTILRTNCVRLLVRQFSDPSVGAVSGESSGEGAWGQSAAAQRESVYWRYESAIKVLESRLNCSLGAIGGLYAVRRELFQAHAGRDCFVEDFQIPLDIRYSGYRVLYDPECLAVEDFAATLPAQFERRVRIGAGNYQVLFNNLGYLNPLNGPVAFAFFSHRVLRWLSPILLLMLLVTSCALASSPAYAIFFALQVAFYLAAMVGLMHAGKGSRLFTIPSTFTMMNLALAVGLVRYVLGWQTMAWQVTPRMPAGCSHPDEAPSSVKPSAERQRVA